MARLIKRSSAACGWKIQLISPFILRVSFSQSLIALDKRALDEFDNRQSPYRGPAAV
jgi:hypothetical protein